MKHLLENIVVFIALSFLISTFAACSKTADLPKDSTDNKTNAAPSKNNDYPPVPSGIMQAEIKDLEGNTFKLEDKKGKILLVNLWATWCGPCRAEMPEFVALQEKYRDKNFEIIGLDSDTDETPEEIKAFAKNMKLNYLLGYADPKFLNEFLKVTRMQGIPQTMLIDREGKMLGVFFGANTANIIKIRESVEKAVNQ